LEGDQVPLREANASLKIDSSLSERAEIAVINPNFATRVHTTGLHPLFNSHRHPGVPAILISRMMTGERETKYRIFYFCSVLVEKIKILDCVGGGSGASQRRKSRYRAGITKGKDLDIS
jgi:hypothetical protein